MSNLQTTTKQELGFTNMEAFANLQRVSKIFNQSSMVPMAFQGDNNLGNAVIAVEMAVRMHVSPLMVMQNLYVVHGTPSWSSKFLIATFNQCGRFSSIKYKFNGKPGTPEYGCYAYATELATGEEVRSITITMAMAASEGWSTKKGSKWQTMPDLMLQYRAAAFLIRTVAPELSMGLESVEEVRDRGAIEVESNVVDPAIENANKEDFIVEAETTAVSETNSEGEATGEEPVSELMFQ